MMPPIALYYNTKNHIFDDKFSGKLQKNTIVSLNQPIEIFFMWHHIQMMPLLPSIIIQKISKFKDSSTRNWSKHPIFETKIFTRYDKLKYAKYCHLASWKKANTFFKNRIVFLLCPCDTLASCKKIIFKIVSTFRDIWKTTNMQGDVQMDWQTERPTRAINMDSFF